jgi:two-component system chemotaxis response regulator CheB
VSIRVLIVDDSSFVRDILKVVLQRYDDIQVCGEARDGFEASAMLIALKPDVVTMDLLMPMVSGLEAVEKIMRDNPTPIVVVADAVSPEELQSVSLKVGAVGVFAKPRGGFDEAQSDALASSIRQAALTNPERIANPGAGDEPSDLSLKGCKVLGIVSSTGGPQTLAKFLGALPTHLQVPVCLVQHTSRGFTETLVHWLAGECELPVEIASDKSTLKAGTITVAPDDLHLEIHRGGIVHLSDRALVNSLRPAGDVLFESLATVYGRKAAALVCTGMGHDGSAGLKKIHEVGGVCLVQDPSTAVLDSMPRSARSLVPTSTSIHLQRLAKLLARDLT